MKSSTFPLQQCGNTGDNWS